MVDFCSQVLLFVVYPLAVNLPLARSEVLSRDSYSSETNVAQKDKPQDYVDCFAPLKRKLHL